MIVLSFLLFSGIAIQGAVWWYSIRAVGKEWGMVGIVVCALAFGVCALMVGLLLTYLWKRLRDMREGAAL